MNKNNYFFLLLFFLFSLPTFGQNLAGPWKGTLELPNGKLDIIFKISAQGNNLKGIMDIPAQQVKGVPIHEIRYESPFLFIKLPNLGIEYVGNVIDDENIEGTFKQGGQSFKMPLIKSLKEETPEAKPQEPRPPFTYLSRNIEFYNKKDGIMLSGTFTRPFDVKRYPTVILISGSGPQDRNQNILGHKPFLVLADEFTKKGIAVLRFDDRGVGGSQGTFENATTSDFATDVEAAIEYLLLRNDVDPTHIGLIGHSEGGIVASMVASKNDKVNFMVLMASPGIPCKDLMLHQKEKIEIISGLPKNIVASNQKIFDKAYDMILNNEVPLQDKLSDFFKHQYHNNISDQQVNSIVKSITNPWFIEFIKTNPENYLSKVKAPVYALNGSKDLQVFADENLEGIENSLKKAGNVRYKMEKLEGLNHLFQECETGLPNEYGVLNQTLSPTFMNKVSEWILEEVKTKK
ncbi:alpha/beta hydrolase family protein [Flammeovirga agarivorans]|uniref:Alpha/beta fold hydrolase n=1 Tax=Flammeovirga agarivorans TaxID=2726742 RepID=A0A7X8SH35_9BACT|nr:alpha/beta fold hydrolase [Flammeovirga agarivorans]NLR90007.1 alpha/beta fold hydrolase [Flammeovirga agarivorans]